MPRARLPAVLLMLTLAFSQRGSGRPAHGRETQPGVKPAVPSEGRAGRASFLSATLDGRRSASGETFCNQELVAAHPSLAFGTLVRVTNLRNGKAVIVRIIDRGPTKACQRSGIAIDLSYAAACR